MNRFKKWLIQVALVCLLLASLIGCSSTPASLGETFDPSGNPFANRFSDQKDIRTATFVVAASDSEHKYEADYFCSGTNDHVQIQAALDALPATGGAIFLLDGTYNIETSLALDSYQTLSGCGKNTILASNTAGLDMITSVGGDGSEHVGVVVRDLCVNTGATNNDDGILFYYTDYSRIENVWVLNNGERGIRLYLCDFCTVTNCRVESSGQSGVEIITCTFCHIEHTISNSNTLHGFFFTITSTNNSIESSIAYLNGEIGIELAQSSNNSVLSNLCHSNSQKTDQTYQNILIGTDSDDNFISNNTCRKGVQANQPITAISIGPASRNIVIGNDFYDGGATAIILDGGTDTRLPSITVPFSDGTEPLDSGYLIDLAGEYARAFTFLNKEVVQVVRIKVYARAVPAEADKMRAEFVIYGGADNEVYTTHDGSVADHPSTSSNFAADDVIYWTITEADVLALLGGDSVEIKVLHEAVGDGDIDTQAYFRTATIEYV